MSDRLGLSVTKSLALLAVGVLIGGLAWLIAILVCHYLLNFGGVDEAQKHGISQVQASRIGGVMIVIYLSLNLCFQVIALGQDVLNDYSAVVLLGGLPFFFLGLFEDWYGVLSARFRFASMIAFAGFVVYLEPTVIITPVDNLILDALIFNYAPMAFVVTVVCLAFLPNAFNTADGANGLVSGVALISTLALAMDAPASLQGLLYSTAVACLLFLLFNLATGRFFLGDGGAYFLGSIVAFSIILTSNFSDVSIWYLLALISYPVIDLFFSMLRRIASGRSPFAADNEHLHNLLFAHFSQAAATREQANTLAGLFIASAFSCLPFGVKFFMDYEVNAVWFYIYALQWLMYVVFWRFLTKKLCAVAQ